MIPYYCCSHHPLVAAMEGSYCKNTKKRKGGGERTIQVDDWGHGSSC